MSFIDNVKWVMTSSSKRMYQVEEAAMPSLIGMRSIGGTPTKGKPIIFAGNNNGHRTITPIMVRKLHDNYIEIHTKTDIIIAKRIR